MLLIASRWTCPKNWSSNTFLKSYFISFSMKFNMVSSLVSSIHVILVCTPVPVSSPCSPWILTSTSPGTPFFNSNMNQSATSGNSFGLYRGTVIVTNIDMYTLVPPTRILGCFPSFLPFEGRYLVYSTSTSSLRCK